MHPSVQIPKVGLETLPVFRPRDPIHPGRRLGIQSPIRRPQPIDRDVVKERGEPLLQRVAQMPLAQVDLGLGPALLDHLEHPRVRVAHDPRRFAWQRGEELPPRRRCGVRKRLKPPQHPLPVEVR